MDLTPYLRWIVFLHVAGAFVFAAGHGVSMAAAFRMRAPGSRDRLATLLEISRWSLNLAGVGLLVLLVAGIVAGIVAGSWSRLWIWTSLVLFVVIGGLMTPLGAFHFNKIRAAAGIADPRAKPGDPAPGPGSEQELAALLASNRPEVLLAVGGGGFLVILWLMMFRPF